MAFPTVLPDFSTQLPASFAAMPSSKRESGWKFALGFQSFQVALHFSATVQDTTSLLQGGVKGQRAPNGHLYFGEPTQSPLRLGKEGTMDLGR